MSDPSSSRVPRVLLADDDEDVCRALQEGLRSFGYEVSVQTDGEGALTALASEDFDVLLLDLDMTPVSGWEIVESLRARERRPATIVLSGIVDVPATVMALRSGVVDVLQKPVRLPELRAHIDEAFTLREEALRARDENEAGDGLVLTASSSSPSRPWVESARGRSPSSLSGGLGTTRLLGSSPAIERVRDQIHGIARFGRVSTLIIGETGTGKEVVAETIHELTAPDQPFVSVNCAAIPESLFESELFGHEAGSFTGARASKPGLFETAGSGTLFLDEIGEMALSMQPKLLRVLQNRKFRRVGGSKDLQLQARVVSATNRKLSAEHRDGMRSDLYFRLAGFTIALPPLRHRREDIDLLANHFLLEFSSQYLGVPTRISEDATQLMASYAWPGNIRELKRVIEQAAVLCKGGVLDRNGLQRALNERGLALQDELVPVSAPVASPVDAFLDAQAPPSVVAESGVFGLNEIQRQLITNAFEAHGHNLTKAARALRIPRTTLRDRLKRYGML